MRQVCLAVVIGAAMIAAVGMAYQDGPYKVLKIAKVGGEGGFDYVNCDVKERKLYVARRAGPGGTPGARLNVFNLDTVEPAGEIAEVSAHGAVVSNKTGHGIASSKPVTLFDIKTQKVIKTIDVDTKSSPDGLLYDDFNDRVYVLSHSAPNMTVINPADGSIVGTIDLGGAPEQAAADGKGMIYVDLEDKDSIGVVDAKEMKLVKTFDLAGKGGTCAGLALDAKNGILFAACRNPNNMVILSAKDGKVLDTLPIGHGTDGAAFNPSTMEAFSSNGQDQNLTVIKENSPTSFVVEQNLKTMTGAKTMTLDTKTGHILLIGIEYQAPPATPAAPPDAQAADKKGGRGARGGRATVPDSFSVVVVGK
jgi:DNA-binding beta-propeller fold protein YncE